MNGAHASLSLSLSMINDKCFDDAWTCGFCNFRCAVLTAEDRNLVEGYCSDAYLLYSLVDVRFLRAFPSPMTGRATLVYLHGFFGDHISISLFRCLVSAFQLNLGHMAEYGSFISSFDVGAYSVLGLVLL